MSIENGKLFEHCFWINFDQILKKDEWEEIEDWCAEVCSGQWMIIKSSASGLPGWDDQYIRVNIYSRAVHTPPSPYGNYSAANIKKDAHKLIIFENQEDAAAFKLKWME